MAAVLFYFSNHIHYIYTYKLECFSYYICWRHSHTYTNTHTHTHTHTHTSCDKCCFDIYIQVRFKSRCRGRVGEGRNAREYVITNCWLFMHAPLYSKFLYSVILIVKYFPHDIFLLPIAHKRVLKVYHNFVDNFIYTRFPKE